MSLSAQAKVEARKRRHRRVRQRVVGTKDRLRLSVFRSNRFLYVQIIDDLAGRTVVCASTREPDIAKRVKGHNTIEAAKALGTAVAERAKAAKVTVVVFDRGGYLYHGKLKALADAARAAGLNF